MTFYVHVSSAPAEELFIKELPINFYDNPFMHQTESLDALFNSDEFAYEPVLTMVNGTPYSLIAWKAEADPQEKSFCTSTAAPEELTMMRLNLHAIPLEDMETIGKELDTHYGNQCPELLLAPGWGTLTAEFNNYAEDPTFVWSKYIMASRSDDHAVLPLFKSALDIPKVKQILTKHTLAGHAHRTPVQFYETK